MSLIAIVSLDTVMRRLETVTIHLVVSACHPYHGVVHTATASQRPAAKAAHGRRCASRGASRDAPARARSASRDSGHFRFRPVPGAAPGDGTASAGGRRVAGGGWRRAGGARPPAAPGLRAAGPARGAAGAGWARPARHLRGSLGARVGHANKNRTSGA